MRCVQVLRAPNFSLGLEAHKKHVAVLNLLNSCLNPLAVHIDLDLNLPGEVVYVFKTN